MSELRDPAPDDDPKPMTTTGSADEDGIIRRFGGAIAGGLVIAGLAGGLGYFLINKDDAPTPRQVQEVVVTVLPPPPPPPPPPPSPDQPKPPEPELIEQPKMAEPEIKEDKPVDQPKEAPPDDAPPDEPPAGPLGMDAAAEGPGDQFNLAGRPGGKGLGLGGGGGGGGGGSKWGWYASIVQQQIEAAMRRNERTAKSQMKVTIRLWADKSGRITRVQLASSTGDAALDAALRNDVLPGITLRSAPPQDMPMPLVTRVTARRPT